MYVLPFVFLLYILLYSCFSLSFSLLPSLSQDLHSSELVHKQVWQVQRFQTVLSAACFLAHSLRAERQAAWAGADFAFGEK